MLFGKWDSHSHYAYITLFGYYATINLW